jgi:hypothetical protein
MFVGRPGELVRVAPVQRTLKILPEVAKVPAFNSSSKAIILRTMKKQYKTRKGEKSVVRQHGYLRRLAKRLFRSSLKHQHADYRQEFDKIIGTLQSIDDSVELIAAYLARKEKQAKQK